MSWMNLKSIYQILVGHVSFSKSVAGPIMIAKMATRSAEVGIMSFLGFMALLSMNLAILNLFPFPALDGGHAVFLVYEGIFRREIPAKVKIAISRSVSSFCLCLWPSFCIMTLFDSSLSPCDFSHSCSRRCALAFQQTIF